MAEYNQAFALTIGHEVGWVHNPKDAGKETYNGIARNYHSGWPGWTLIDLAKNSSEFPENIPDKKLFSLVQSFYRSEFWEKIKGDQLPDQDIANWLFDIAVNGSPIRAGRFLQQSLNLLNRNERDYPDLLVDGIIGKKTISILKQYLLKRDRLALLFWIGTQMAAHWMNRAQNKEDQEEFFNGIGNRWITNIQHVADKIYFA